MVGVDGEYRNLIIFSLLSNVIAVALVIVSLVAIVRKGEVEKLTAYECGFHPFEDTRTKFDVRFYLFAILFLIFDLEIIFLFPWVVYLGEFRTMGGFVVIFFLAMLTLGFVYEWEKGALEW
jgi:NADH-quinone oxidoreductase subunit A